MAYVDGFVVAVPRDKLDAYKEMARLGGTVWREHGALSFTECVEDDVKPGKLTSFPQAVKLEEGEVCVFSWITYESRAARDAITEKVMRDRWQAHDLRRFRGDGRDVSCPQRWQLLSSTPRAMPPPPAPRSVGPCPPASRNGGRSPRLASGAGLPIGRSL
jgi:uncharacterized protein YbaA (DUF1428 family)